MSRRPECCALRSDPALAEFSRRCKVKKRQDLTQLVQRTCPSHCRRRSEQASNPSSAFSNSPRGCTSVPTLSRTGPHSRRPRRGVPFPPPRRSCPPSASCKEGLRILIVQTRVFGTEIFTDEYERNELRNHHVLIEIAHPEVDAPDNEVRSLHEFAVRFQLTPFEVHRGSILDAGSEARGAV